MMEAPTHTGSMDPAHGHSRTRTTSSNVFPSQQSQHHHYQQQHYAQQQHPSQQQQYSQHQLHQHQQHLPHQQQLHPHHQSHQQQHHQMHSAQQYHSQQPSPHSASNPQLWRRSPSIGAFSTSSSFHQPPPAAYRTSTSDLRRSTSSRSVTTQGGGSSYVALLRKQKATVWCERAQYEDPRVVAQQRAAKMRANLEVVSGNNSGRTQTGLTSAKVAGKIRHGKAPVVGYAPGETHVGVGGVPLRLSAREIDGDGNDAASGRAQSSRSGGSERRDDVLELGQGPKLAHNSKLHSALTREKSVKSPEELKRRGSVDERTSTLTSGRLFIANPD
ncbi:hypothetical protein LLEC1_05469 [Akanthomyces lecanii]|uniref:Uncharacterized protein n=1 Tax=Cordyceps confragosa TaxID=2714763 RepID=A0A179IB77_CORDF|nr:hypothetical protein LLEC1_05469 [Akanthomyces lecanii]